MFQTFVVFFVTSLRVKHYTIQDYNTEPRKIILIQILDGITTWWHFVAMETCAMTKPGMFIRQLSLYSETECSGNCSDYYSDLWRNYGPGIHQGGVFTEKRDMHVLRSDRFSHLELNSRWLQVREDRLELKTARCNHNMSFCWTVNTLKNCGMAFKGIIKNESSLQRPWFYLFIYFWGGIDFFFCLLLWCIILQVTAKKKRNCILATPEAWGGVCHFKKWNALPRNSS